MRKVFVNILTQQFSRTFPLISNLHIVVKSCNEVAGVVWDELASIGGGGAMLLDAVCYGSASYTKARRKPSGSSDPGPAMDFSESFISSRIYTPFFSASGTLQCLGHVPYVRSWLGGP